MNASNSVGGSGEGDGIPIVIPRPPLRTPKEDTLSRLKNKNGVIGSDGVSPNATDQRSFASIVKEHKPLNIAADVFIPRQNSSNLSACAPEFVPIQPLNNPCFQNPAIQHSGDDSNIYNIIMQELNTTISILTSQPGNVDEYMNRLCQHLVSVQCTSTLDSIIETLYDQCINETNFRYTGAKMCQYFCKNLKDHSVFKKFRGCLLNRCKKDFEQREHLLSRDQTAQIYGLAMFMSELFLNLEVECDDGRITKFDILASSSSDIALSLLAHPSKDNIKCVVQMLKLAGASIEDSLITKSSSLNEVFNRLTQLQASSDVHENAKFMIKSVVDLRANNWGRGESVSSADGLTNDMNDLNLAYNVYENEPVFYNAQGHPISRAEAGYQDDIDESAEYLLNEDEDLAFLEWEQNLNPNQYPAWSDHEAYGYIADDVDPEFTSEMMDDYEVFLKNT